MSRVIEQYNSMRRLALKPRRIFKSLALGSLLGLPLLTAYSQTVSLDTRNDQPESSKAQTAYAPRTVNGAPLPNLSALDIPLLIQESDRLGTAMHLRLPEYTYLQTRLSREPDRRGKLVENVSVYEAYPITILGHHRHIISMISENGAKISPKRLKEERQRAAEEMEAAERERVLRDPGAPATGAGRYITAGIGLSQAGGGVWIGISQFLKHCRFGTPRYERLDDRDMIALNIQSCDSDVKSPQVQYLSGMAGVVWIDAVDKVVARMEAWPKTEAPEQKLPFSSPESETFVYEQTRLSNGLWVPKRIRLNAVGKAWLFNGTDKDMTFGFSQYQHFNTEVDDLQQITLTSKP
jgi:hypothetical protein